jgi:hypothetical protein
MNCTRCGMPLETNARFCRNCGLPAPVPASNGAAANVAQPHQSLPMQNRLTEGMPKPVNPSQTPYYQPVSPIMQPTQPVMPGAMASNLQDGQPATFPGAGKTRHRRRGWITGSLIILLVLIVVGAGWFLALRPYLHSLVQSHIDQVFSDTVSQIPPVVALLPPGIVQVDENAINVLIALKSQPSDPVQNAQVHITPSNVRMDFQVFGFPCAIVGVPEVINGPLNGQLVITNVTVEGIAALILSPDELTSLVNGHLADVQKRFNHPINGVQLQDHTLVLNVGPPSGIGLPGGIGPP